MKILEKIFKYSAAALMSLLVWGCHEDESLLKPTALLVDSDLTFEAQGSEPQLLMIASDDYWRIDVAEEWITVDPMEGNNTMHVTVTVSDNVVNGVVSAPRTGTISVANLSGYVVTSQINQKGDNYLGVSEMSLASARALENGKFAKIAEAQVVAIAAEGFIVSDATDMMFIKSTENVAVGDKVFLAGEKKTLYSTPVLEAGEVTVKSTGEVTRPEAADFVSSLDPSNASKITYVSFEAGLLGRTLYFADSLPVTVTVLDPKSGDIDLEEVNMHNIAAKAYFVALDGAEVKLVLTEVEDKGINDELNAYFYEDFSWMKALIDASGVKVDDSIADNNASGAAPNLRTNSDLEPLLDEFLARGYEDLNQSAKVIYPQRCYWKFGKSNDGKLNNGGIKLPPMNFDGDQLINVDMQFNWAAHMTGTGNIDKVSVVVELEGNGFFDNGTNISDPFVTTQQKGNLQWQDASLMVRGVNNTTRFIVRPKDFDKTDPNQQRWYIDNIKISASDIPYSDPVFANVTVSEEVVTFAGTPKSPVSITIKSDNDWTLTKDTESTWFSYDVTEGAAAEEVTVTITCEPSTSADLRKGYITLASADTRKNIYVVQSAAGGELAPLIGIVGGNSKKVIADAGSFALTVQSNVTYQYESDASWVTFEAAPETRALVEETSFVVNYEANTESVSRIAHIRVYNATENLEAIYTLEQAGYVSGIYFQDDFSWITPMAKSEGASDSVGTDNPGGTAPNVWKMASSADFFAKFNEIGYSYLYGTVGGTQYLSGPAPEPNASVGKDGSIYIQDSYLKFGQGSYNVSLVLPALTEISGNENVLVEFDWCWQVTGAYKPDLMTLSLDTTVGEFALTGASTSKEIESEQSKVDEQSHLAWQHASVILTGATAETIITIRPTYADPAVQNPSRKQNRWYLDNIKVSKYEGVIPEPEQPAPDPEPEPTPDPDPIPSTQPGVIASFPFPNDTEFDASQSSVQGKWNLTEGWILSEDGRSKLSASHATDFSYRYEAKGTSDAEGTKDHVRVCVKSLKLDDYWQFEVPVSDVPAGIINICFNQSSSAAGPNYFLVEVSIDGTNWTPVGAQTTTESYTLNDTETTREVTWTYALNRDGKNAANVAYPVNLDIDIPAMPGNNKLYLRTKVSSVIAFSKAREVGAGYNRIWGPCEVTFKKK